MDPSQARSGYSDSFEVRVRRTTARSASIELIGTLDFATADEFTAALQCYEECRLICLDVAGVTFLDCAGIGSLVALRQRVAERSGRLLVLDPPPFVQRLLTITGLEELLGCGEMPSGSGIE